jgi:hypothetical protein
MPDKTNWILTRCVRTHGEQEGPQGCHASGCTYLSPVVCALEQEGLQVLLRDGNVFGCHASLADAVWHAEMGASLAILDAGFNIDSLMLRYQVCAPCLCCARCLCRVWVEPCAGSEGALLGPGSRALYHGQQAASGKHNRGRQRRGFGHARGAGRRLAQPQLLGLQCGVRRGTLEP